MKLLCCTAPLHLSCLPAVTFHLPNSLPASPLWGKQLGDVDYTAVSLLGLNLTLNCLS